MTKENTEIKLQQSIIPEFSSGSSTHVVLEQTQQALKTLKQVQGLSYFKPQYQNVGQALPDNKSSLVENNSCVVGPEQPLLRTSTLSNSPLIRATSTFPLMGKLSSPRRERKPVGQVRETGFTLIELLVVVLIIGILAAIALPQYQMAVRKTRLVQLITVADAIKKAEESYYLTNGQYTSQRQDLDIVFLNNEFVSLALPSPKGTTSSPSFLSVQDSRLPGILILYGMNHSGNKTWNNRRACYATKTNTQADLLCQYATGQKTPSMTDSRDNKYFFE